jgi:apolipoprotein D and lipocalin family protein
MALPRVLAAMLWLAPLAAHAALPPPLPAGSPNAPVAELDVDRYMGLWHEVARRPMFFQRDCVGDTTATYERQTDGGIRVRNACRTADGLITSSGMARRAGQGGALEVRFAPGWLGWLPFVWADYWVVDLDPDYTWAVVGGPGQGAMWVLSREPTLDPDLLERILERAAARGYRRDDLIVDPAQRARPGVE